MVDQGSNSRITVAKVPHPKSNNTIMAIEIDSDNN